MTEQAPTQDAPQTPPLVAIRGVSKVYERGRERIEVLHHVDLDIPEGDFLALMGPSGSGKSTLLNMIAGLDVPTDGSLSVAGRQIERLSATELARWRAANVGFVFQFYNLLPALSAQKNVELPLLLTRLSAARRRRHASIALELVGLSDRATHKPNASPAASNSGSPLPAPSSRTRRFWSATSRPAISTVTPPRRCWPCCSG